MNKNEFKILITGANGFLGKNLYFNLLENNYKNIFKADANTSFEDLKNMILSSDLIYNFAGVNRPKDDSEFSINNTYLNQIIDILKTNNKKIPIVLSSSIQSDLNNPYGISKKKAEELLIKYSKDVNVQCFIYKFPNIFGKWSKPNYNSAVATFCYNISRGIDIVINDKNAQLKLVYIDDVVLELKNIADYLVSDEKKDYEYNINKTYYNVESVYDTTVGYIAEKIYSFKESRINYYIPNLSPNSLEKKLYSTYLSFLDENDFKYSLNTHSDNRGSFTEILKTNEYGQFSVNIIKQGITKGNHYHNTKNEKYLVVSGKVLIQFKKIDDEKIISFEVSDEKLEIVDIPPGYAHNIKNIGNEDAVVFMWANEVFDKDNTDTFNFTI